MAVKSNNAAIVETLLSTGINIINTVSVQNQKSALMYAVSAGKINSKLIDLLLDYKINVNVQDSLGNTALMYAAQRGDVKTVNVLLEANADITIKNENGEDAIDIAWNTGNEELYELLDPGRFRAQEMEKLSISPQMKIDVIFKKSDLDSFKQCSTDDEKNTFIEQYIEAHKSEGVYSKAVVYGLALRKSVAVRDVEIIEKIEEYILKECSNSISYILRFVDNTNCSIIYAALFSEDPRVRENISGFVRKASEKGLLQKTPDILPDEVQHFISIIDSPVKNGDNAQKLYTDFMCPIYTDEALLNVKEELDILGDN